MQKIITDIDDTALNYTKGLLEFANIQYPHGQQFSNISDFLTSTHGYTSNETTELIQTFNTSENFKHLEPLQGADTVLKNLHNDGVKISVITACGDDKVTRELRYYNLRNVFGDIFENIIFLPLGARKLYNLMPYMDRNPVFIEDSLIHYKDGVVLGFDSYMIKGPMNAKEIDDTNHFTHWDEFYKRYHENHI